jgi:hypothetical protein
MMIVLMLNLVDVKPNALVFHALSFSDLVLDELLRNRLSIEVLPVASPPVK